MRTVRSIAFLVVVACTAFLLGPGLGLVVDASLTGTGSAGAPLRIPGGTTAASGEVLTTTGGGITWTKPTITTSGAVTGTGSAGSPVAVSTATLSFGYAGDGIDGALTFDGTTTIVLRGTSVVPVANVYTLPRDIFCDGCTINSGVSVNPGGWRFHDRGVLTLNGKIVRNGNDGSGTAAGATVAANFIGGGSAAGTGGIGGTAGTSGASLSGMAGTCSNTGGTGGTTNNPGVAGGACKGGGGGGSPSGSGNAGGGLSLVLTTQANFRYFTDALSGRTGPSSNIPGGGGSGGGGGRGAVTPATVNGGGGGSGAGAVVVIANQIVGTGVVEAKGGAGAAGSGTNAGGGGGGGGGSVAIYISTGSFPTIDVSGGAGGASGGGTGGAGGAGGAGVTSLIRGAL